VRDLRLLELPLDRRDRPVLGAVGVRRLGGRHRDPDGYRGTEAERTGHD